MKKRKTMIATVCALLAVCLLFSACKFVNPLDWGGSRSSHRIPSKGQSVFENGIDTVDTDINNADCFLTHNKFFFNSEGNTRFGDGEITYVYDLTTGKIKPLLDFDAGIIAQPAVAGDILYFAAYTNTTYDTDYNWGEVLFAYDLNTQELQRIYETPNTFDYIRSFVLGDRLIYVGGNTEQEADSEYGSHSIYMLNADGSSTVLKKDIGFMLSTLHEGRVLVGEYRDDGDGMQGQAFYSIDRDGVITPEAEETAAPILEAERFGDEEDEEQEEQKEEEPSETVNGKTVVGQYGDYWILQTDEDILEEFDNGYEYTITYSLYNAATGEEFPLTDAYRTLFYA